MSICGNYYVRELELDMGGIGRGMVGTELWKWNWDDNV